jgi:uncharacterized protein
MTENDTNQQQLQQNRRFLEKLIKTKMPFGKYAGRLLIDLPEPYVVWFSRQGFPKGELGQMLQIVYEIKANGLEYLFKGNVK